ncbi:Transmembrane protein 8B [Armadillidium vulgare]|nr:Transmembrane protein 8B [Armadillidium vulgare]
MQQEGLIHKCRYSLGSVAMWSQKDHIRTLNIGLPQRISTLENLSYFRFYVPSHTWLVKVNISNCRIREKFSSINDGVDGPRWCIRSASLSARALPEHKPDLLGIANISEGLGHTFIEKHPYSDSYYYLLVFTEGETDLTVTIKTKECGSLQKKPYTTLLKRARLSSSLGSSSSNLTANHSVSYIVNSSDSKLNFLGENGTIQLSYSTKDNTSSVDKENNTNSNSIWSEITSSFVLEKEDSAEGFENDSGIEEDEEGKEHKCFPILPLARIKHSRDFTDTFLVQGPEWFSTWVSVHGETPVFTHMTLLPYTDIGGTLSITLHMDELLMNATNQLISVIGCVKKGRPPLVNVDKLECEKDLTLNISTASFKTVEDFLLIPFPEPDVWYLALHVVCYYKGVRSPCIISHVMVSIDVRTQPCVYAGEEPCGTHGVCQETHRGMFFFSSCICQEGWQGWGCHNGQYAQTWPSFLSSICLLTLSNIFFLPPILLAAKWRFYSQALLFTATMIASVFYHACDSEVFSYCLTRYEVLQFTDFFFSLLCFWVTIISLCGFYNEKELSFLQFLGVIIIAPAVQYSRTALMSFILPIGLAVVILVSKILYRRFYLGEWPAISKRRFLIRCLGVTFAVAGLCLFAFIQTKDNYKYVHSAWHTIIALSLMFLLPSKRPYKRKGSSRISSSSTSSSSISRRHHSSFSYIDTSKYSEDIDEDDEDLIDIRDPGASSSPVFQSSTVPVDADVDLIVFGSDPDRGENEKILCIDNDGPM